MYPCALDEGSLSIGRVNLKSTLLRTNTDENTLASKGAHDFMVMIMNGFIK